MGGQRSWDPEGCRLFTRAETAEFLSLSLSLMVRLSGLKLPPALNLVHQDKKKEKNYLISFKTKKKNGLTRQPTLLKLSKIYVLRKCYKYRTFIVATLFFQQCYAQM